MKISIVIPSYNGEEILKKNLPKVLDALSEIKSDSELIIVDDGSSDGSVEFLKKFRAENSNSFSIKILINERNLGFSSTVNSGVKNAQGELVILLNSDVEPSRDFISYLIPHFEDDKVFAVGCLDRSEENGRIVERGRGVGSFKRGFLVHQRGEVDKTNTLWAAGGSSIFRKSIWEVLSGLDEIYNPFYWEDIDLSFRALKSGYKIIFEPKSIVTHRHFEGSIRKTYSERKVKTIAFRNQFIFVWKNTDPNTLFWHLTFLPYHFLKGMLTLNIEFFQGFLSALLKIPGVIESRARSKKTFIKKDSEVVKDLSK